MTASIMFWLPLLLCCTASLALPLPEEHDSEESRKVLGSSVVTSVSVITETENGTKTKYFTDAAGRPMERPKTGSDVGSPVDLISPDRYQFYTFDQSGNLVKRYMTRDEVKSIIANGQKSEEMQQDGPTFYHGPTDGADLAIEPTEEIKSDSFAQDQAKMHSVLESVQNVLRSQLDATPDNTQVPNNAQMTPDTSASWSMILPSYLGNNADVLDTLEQSQLAASHNLPITTSTHSNKPSAQTSSESLPIADAPAKDSTENSNDSNSSEAEEIVEEAVEVEGSGENSSEVNKPTTIVQSTTMKAEPVLTENSSESAESSDESEEKVHSTTNTPLTSEKSSEESDESLEKGDGDSVSPNNLPSSEHTGLENTETNQPLETSSNISVEKSSTESTPTSSTSDDEAPVEELSTVSSVGQDITNVDLNPSSVQGDQEAESLMSADEEETPNVSASISLHSEENLSSFNKVDYSPSSKTNLTSLPSSTEISSTTKEPVSASVSSQESVEKSPSTTELENQQSTTENSADKSSEKPSVDDTQATGTEAIVHELNISKNLTQSLSAILTQVSEEAMSEVQMTDDDIKVDISDEKNTSTDDEIEKTTKITSENDKITESSNESQEKTTIVVITSVSSSESSQTSPSSVSSSPKEDSNEDAAGKDVEDNVSSSSETVERTPVKMSELSNNEEIHEDQENYNGTNEQVPTKPTDSEEKIDKVSSTLNSEIKVKTEIKELLETVSPIEIIPETKIHEKNSPIRHTTDASSEVITVVYEEGITQIVPKETTVKHSDDFIYIDRSNEDTKESEKKNANINSIKPLIQENNNDTSEEGSGSGDVESQSSEEEEGSGSSPISIKETKPIPENSQNKNRVEGSSSEVDSQDSSKEEGSGSSPNDSTSSEEIVDNNSSGFSTSGPSAIKVEAGEHTTESISSAATNLSISSKMEIGSDKIIGVMEYADNSNDIGITPSIDGFEQEHSESNQENDSNPSTENLLNLSKYLEGDQDYGIITQSVADKVESLQESSTETTVDLNSEDVITSHVTISNDEDASTSTSVQEPATEKITSNEQNDENVSAGKIDGLHRYVVSDQGLGVTESPLEVTDTVNDTSIEQNDENANSGSEYDVEKYINSDTDLGVTESVNEEQKTTTEEDVSEDTSGTMTSTEEIYDINKYITSNKDIGITISKTEDESTTKQDDAASNDDVNLNFNKLTSNSESESSSTEDRMYETTTMFDIDKEMNDQPLEIIATSNSEESASEKILEKKNNKQEEISQDKKDNINFYKTPIFNLNDKHKYPQINTKKSENKKPLPTDTTWQKVDVLSPNKPNHDSFPQNEQPQDSSSLEHNSESSGARPPNHLDPSPVELHPAPQESLGLEASTVNLFQDVQRFADLCNELAFKMWLSATGKGISAARSIAMSPFAVTSMLSMIFLGAKGPTSGQMNDILRLDDMLTFNPHQVFRNVTESVILEANQGVSTAAFVRELYSDNKRGKMLDFYKQRAAQFYDGHVEEVNFSNIGDILRRRTNLLVKKQTSGKVSEYMRGSNLGLQAPLAAFSANIFQTDCSSASTEGRDGEMYFTILPATRQRRLVPVPAVVYRSGFMAGYEPSLDATVVSLGQPDSSISTLFVLPGQQGQLAPGDGLPRLESRLLNSTYVDGAWSKLLRSLLPRTGLEIQIPRFSHRSQLNLTHSLQTMGLNDLFDPFNADLKGLSGTSSDLHVSDIVQVNTFSTCGEEGIGSRHHVEIYPAGSPIRVGRDEDGDEDNLDSVPLALRPRQARLDTNQEHLGFEDFVQDNIYQMPLALRPRQARIPEGEESQPRLKFDRPFLYFVRHNPTGFILHMGRFNPRLNR